MPLFIFSLNVNRVEHQIFLKNESIITNYLPYVIDLNDFFQYMNLFNDEFENFYKFSPKDFVAFISALTIPSLEECMDTQIYAFNLLQRAYTIFDSECMDYLRKNFEFLYNSYYGILPPDFELRFNNIFNFLKYDNTHASDIDLKKLVPRKLFIKIDNFKYIFDYSGIITLLTSIMLPLSRLDGDVANKRSEHFEIKTNEYVKKIFGQNSFWIGRKEIYNSKNEAIEIDSSFVIDDILFILECKSINVSLGFFKGDQRALDYRKNKNISALQQVNKKIEFLYKFNTGSNYSIPSNVKYIVSLIVSPYPEYIWEFNEELFLTSKIPRIIVLDELNDIKNIKNFNEIKNNKFTIKISL